VAVGTGGETAEVSLWDLSHSKSSPVWASRRSSDVYALGFNVTGDRLAVGSSDGTLSHWDLRGGSRTESIMPKQQALISSVAFAASDGVLASVARGRNPIRLWHPTAPGRPEVLGGSRGSDQVYALGLARDGGLLASADGRANTVRVWDLRTSAAPFSTLRYGADDASSEILSVATSPDGTLVAAGTGDSFNGDNALLVWRLADKGRGPIRARAESAMRTLVFAPDGKWLAAATELQSEIAVWSVATSFKDVRRIPLKARVVAACFASTGGRLIVALDDNSLSFLQPQSAQPHTVTQFARDAGSLTSVACLESGGGVATGANDGRVRVWDAAGRPLFDLPGQDGPVTAIGTDKSARILVTGNDRGTIRVWTLDNPTHVPIVIPSTLSRVASLVVDPYGEWIAAAGADARVLKLDLTATLLRKMEARLWRNLTLPEWSRFIGEGLAPRATFNSLPPPQ
jgi:WD40 repeat protein